MGRMVWKDDYSVGNAVLDSQHRELMELVNRLDGDEPLSLLLEELARYAAIHFRTEEKLLQAVGYPDLDQQKFQHKAFRAWLDRTLADWDSGGERLVASRDLKAYLRVWIANHLQVYDAAFKPWLKK